MKNKILLLGLSVALFSCSSDDDSGNQISTGDFLPLETSNYWVYDVESDAVENGTGRDSLYIYGETQINGEAYKTFQTENPAWGFFSNALRNNNVRKSGSQLLLTGEANFDFYADLPFTASVNDLPIFNDNANNNQILGSISDQISETYEGYDLDFDYTLTSTAKESMESYTVNGVTYNNVKAVEMKLNLSVTINFNLNGMPIPVNIMPAQDVVISTQYYAENIGVVHVVTDFEYELADLSQYPIELPIPEASAVHQEEVLVNYSVE
ncbi:hypothetical protein GCM10007424_02590 [Flavobacterium suaedae]|uniref:Uncharacterized protein n=1 Tax=Flavobacterium suaedae TaxID=1767027 RepID=A0ABQ1JH24_9FLAO|nr:hypothetical protein [Flavobacterium suaedae]GGB66121.1 hypothetical protein GCM10007424_02590 [Flavobacterium suaedae]